jgi:hypothetical protein
LKINSVLSGSLLIQESGWLLTLTVFRVTVRTHKRPNNFGAQSAELVGEVAEPLLEIFQRKHALVDPALDGDNGTQQPRLRKPNNSLPGILNQD